MLIRECKSVENIPQIIFGLFGSSERERVSESEKEGEKWS